MTPTQLSTLSAIVRQGQIEFSIRARRRDVLEALATLNYIVLGEVDGVLVAEPTRLGHEYIKAKKHRR